MSKYAGKFFVEKKSSQRKLKFYKEITNGVLLMEFTPEDGRIINGTEVYISNDDFNSNWEKFQFELPQNVAHYNYIRQFIKDFIYQLTNYGIEEEKFRGLTEMLHTETGCMMISDWIELEDKTDVNKFMEYYLRQLNEDYRWEVESYVEDTFPFITEVIRLATSLANQVSSQSEE